MTSYEKNILAFNEQLTVDVVKTADLGKLGKGGAPDAIVVVGMGGSGLVASLLQNLANDVTIPVPVIPWKNFGLPELSYVERPLYLFVSFSGGTKEVLDGFRLARKIGKARVAVVTSGGELLRIAEESRLPRASFPAHDLAPRQATGIMFYGSLAVLRSIWPSMKAPNLSAKVSPERFRAEAKRIAGVIGSGNAAVFAEGEDSHLAYFWKVHLNETGKTFASWNVLPEMNHNEIVGFELRPKAVTAIFLVGNPKDARAKAIREVTAAIIERYGTRTVTVEPTGKTRIERTMNSLALGALTSVELAKFKGIDPKETRIIEEIKKKISKFR